MTGLLNMFTSGLTGGSGRPGAGRCPIGVDFGQRSIRMLQLQHSKEGGFTVAAAATRAVPDSLPSEGPQRVEALGKLLSDMISSDGFSGRQVISSLAATSLQYKNLRIAKMPASDMQSAVEWEASDRLQMDAKNMQVQFFDAGDVTQGEEDRREIILMGVSKDVVRAHVDSLVASHLRPLAVECVPSALARFASFGQDPDGAEAPAQVVLDVGYSSTKVMVVRHGRVLFFKLIDIGGRTLDHAVSGHLDLSPAEAADLRHRLVSERAEANDQAQADPRRQDVQRAVFEAIRATVAKLGPEIGLCLRYYSVTFRGRRPESAILVGGEARDPQLAHLLSEQAGVQIEPARPPAWLDPGDTAVEPDTVGSWAVAIGLSMRHEARSARKRGAA